VLHRLQLPGPLEEAYGAFGLPDEVVYANFASSVDGVVAFEPGVRRSAGSLLTDGRLSDRFLMGLLRACADAILIGAGTLRAEPEHLWTPGHVYPDAAVSFALLRAGLGLAPEPELVVVSASGRLPLQARALRKGATILTTPGGARRLELGLPAASRVETIGEGSEVELKEALAGLRARGLGRLLTEGGPRLAAGLVAGGLLDELFLTLAPVLAGRRGGDRPGLVEGIHLLPGRRLGLELLGLRRDGPYLFLHYRKP
jgi:riboflavin biosynthesis pyrimidine reductase